MKTRSNHIGGWRWRLRMLPWVHILGVSWFLLMVAVVVMVSLVIVSAEPAR